MNTIKKVIIKIVKILIKVFSFLFKVLFRQRELFEIWEEIGYHVVPAHFYQPVPILKELKQDIFEEKFSCKGIDFNEQNQQMLLANFKAKYKDEYDNIPLEGSASSKQYYINNKNFESVDGEILYCMVRDLKPKTMIEVGSGYSTLASLLALEKNKTDTKFTAIEPYPREFFIRSISPFVNLIKQKVQEVDLRIFNELQENDILFIDSSHVLKIGSDVYYEYLEIIPNLNKGVVIHIHDIFLPYDYPRKWVFEDHIFWNEQYLLQAFLSYNDHFEVLWSGSFMHHYHSKQLTEAFRSYGPTRSPGSFWIRKIK